MASSASKMSMATVACLLCMVGARILDTSSISGLGQGIKRRVKREPCSEDNSPLHCPMEDTQHLCTVGPPGQLYPRYLHLGQCSRWNPGDTQRARDTYFNCKACCRLESGVYTIPKCHELSRSGGETCYCGASKYERMARMMVVGGNESFANEFPWQVSLQLDGEHQCGGSLLSSTTVLTAAHCSDQTIPLSHWRAVLGEHDLRVDHNEVRIGIASWTNHPLYSLRPDSYLDNDFAILKLERPVRFTRDILPICLPTGTNYEHRSAIVTGWGTLGFGGRSPDRLQKANIRTITNRACTSGTLHSVTEISTSEICITGDGTGFCIGDSGGAVVVKKRNTYYEQIGVVSWTRGCAREDAPGVTARVTSALDWILSNIDGRTCPPP